MKTNFYIFAIVAINQIYNFQSSRGDFTVELNDNENNEVREKAVEVGKILSLNNITQLPETSKEGKTIKQCFDDNKNNYETMIKFLNEKISETGKNLSTALKGKYKEQVESAQEQLTSIAELLKEYPSYLSSQLNKFLIAVKRIRSKSFTFRKYLEGYYVALKDIEKKEKGRANDALKTYKLTLEIVQNTSESTIMQIKTCMGENEPFVPIKNIDNTN